MRAWAAVAAALLLLPAGAASQQRPAALSDLAWTAEPEAPGPATARRERPPLSTGRIAAQLAAGAAGGTVGAAVLGGALATLMLRDTDGWEQLAGLAIGAVVGYPLGAAGGVVIAGNTQGQTGSAWATFAGSALGAGLGALTGNPLGYVVLVPVGAVAGFHSTRRYRSPPPAADR